jgi:hypothetical protein
MNALPVLLIVGFLGGEFGAAAPQGAGPATAEQLRIEAFLKGAKIGTVEKATEVGRGAAWRVTLRDESGTQRGFFKYVNVRRPQVSPISYKYELAAYLLSKLLGVPVIPPVVEREVDGRKGSLQIYLEGCVSETERRKTGKPAIPDPRALADAFEEMALIEGLTACHHDINDILIHKDTGRVCRVDFAEAFDPSPELPSAAAQAIRCSRRLFAGLKALDPAEAEAALAPYLNAAEIKGLLARRALLLDKFTALVVAKGEAAVLFDLVAK